MSFIFTFICFVLVLGITIFIHELGHFLFAKKAGIYVYEFSLGMGPQIFKFNRKNDETDYCIRLFPIGGFVQMAGEEIEMDENIPEEKRMQSKTWLQRFMTVIAGVLFNFILAIILLFVVALLSGVSTTKPIILEVDENYMASTTNLQSGDTIIKVNGKSTPNTDMFLLEMQVNSGKNLKLRVKHENGEYETITIEPKQEELEGEKIYRYGFSLESEIEKGFLVSIKYAFEKTISLINQMIHIIWYLITGKLELNSLSGPIGIYNVVGDVAKTGIINMIYLVAYLCINVGFMNLLPIPALDGFRAFFLIIEKIKGSPVNPKIENTINAVGLMLLMVLMVVITWNDIFRFIL